MRKSSHDGLGVSVHVTVGATIVELNDLEYGSMNDLGLEQISSVLLSVADETNPPSLIVNLSKVEFLGARLIGVLVSAWKRLKRREGRMALCGLTPACAKLARVLCLDKLFEIYPTQRMALQATSGCVVGRTRHGAPVRIRIRVSDVKWDSKKVRLEYLTDSQSPIYSRILPRNEVMAVQSRLYGNYW
jgi:anti-sigma B factor antagonist/stage II sporulation protein AA (anti-sigma F factor antagonist)